MQFSPKQIVFFGVLLAVPIASYFLVFQPQNAGIDRAKKEMELKRAALEKLREATSKTADLRKANEAIAASISSISERLPSGKELDNVLRDVAGIAARNGLDVPQFKRSDKSLPQGLAQEQPLMVTLSGDFEGMYAFFLQLEQLHRITRVTDMKFARFGDKNNNEDGKVRADLVLSIYYRGDDADPASAGGKH
ncbi:N/A [soil metagenome]